MPPFLKPIWKIRKEFFLLSFVSSLILIYLAKRQHLISSLAGEQKLHTNSLEEIEREFRNSWIRQREYRTSWKQHLGICDGFTSWKDRNKRWDPKLSTSASTSIISKLNIRPAGQYSSIFIETYTKGGLRKHFGGDSWRVEIFGSAEVAPTVFDLQNGTYEALFLLVEPGPYKARISLDYTLCRGLIDMQEDWFKLGSAEGGDQPIKTKVGNSDYLIEPLLMNGSMLEFTVEASDTSFDYQRFLSSFIKDFSSCKTNCSFLWDGFGRWVQRAWTPYYQGDLVTQTVRNISDLVLQQQGYLHFKPNASHSRLAQRGALHNYGDSIAWLFRESIKKHSICTEVYSDCLVSYLYTYKRRSTHRDPSDYNLKRVLLELREDLVALEQTNGSVMVLNYGLHTVRSRSFPNFQELLRNVIELIKTGNKGGPFNTRVVWKTTTAPRKENTPRKRLTSFRFLTYHRVQLFNAYAHAEMCRAGIQVVDVFPLTSSFEKGTYDHVHYPAHVMEPLEKILIIDAQENDLTSNNWYDRMVSRHPRQYCVKWTNT